MTAAPPPPSAIPGDRTRRLTRWVGLVLLGLMVVLWVGKGARIAALPVDQLVSWNVTIDDGYYYLQVARNLARGEGATFDRVNRTNGFQPLWAATLVPIFWFTDDPGTGLKAALWLATLLGAGAMVLLFFALARLAGHGAALLLCALLVANPYYLRLLQGGLETPALLVCLAGLIAFWARRGERVLGGERRSCVQLSLLLALTCLARLDVALALGPLALVVVLWGRRGLGARLLWVALPGLLLLAPYLGWNWVQHGSPVPVSGQVKAWVAATYTPSWELFRATEQWRGLSRTVHEMSQLWNSAPEPTLDLLPKRLLVPAVLLALLALRLLWSRRARGNRVALVLLLGAGLGVAVHGLYLFFVYRSCGHWNYHYFFPLALLWSVSLALVLPLLLSDLGLVLDRWLRGRLRRGFSALALALALPGVGLLTHWGLPQVEQRYQQLQRSPAQSFRKCRLDAARNLAKNFPRDTVFGAWWAGTLGYFSDRRVVNLDGVINSGDYFRRYLKPDRVARYILEGPITHLVDFFWRNPLNPGVRPAARVFFWEHDKEHVIKRLQGKLRLVHRVPYRGASGTYIIDVIK